MGICTSKPLEEADTTPSKFRRNSYLALETTSNHGNSPFPKEVIGFHSNHGIKPAGFGSAAKINQDRGVIQYPLANDNGQMLLAVYDGHGQHGEHCSEFVAFECIELLESDPAGLSANPRDVLFKQIVEADARLRKKRDVPSYESGTTAIVCVMRPDRIWTACVGDSRAVMGREEKPGEDWKAIDLSQDQKPDNPEERKRIEANGGFVSEASEAYGPARVWRFSYGLGPGLAMARSIGDHAVAELGVFAEPEITEKEVTSVDRCVVLASDGVWEFISSQEAIGIIQKHSRDATAACKALIAEASLRWKKEEGNYRDDITAIVCFLPAIKTLANMANANGQSCKSKAEFDADIQGKEESAKMEVTHGANPPATDSLIPVAEPEGTKAEQQNAQQSFVRRRLSVANVPKDDQEGA
mmetsp:Transcript_16904/g.35650  ORF Transcript_16904/g.35650 Transcript_16904/m.35650 type:complete len:413 (-) Transcript_16904:536-1774(-)